MSADAMVVGSGPNGLAAAVTLARSGLAVHVIEGAETPGGGCRTAELTLPGFRHDVCSAVHPLALGSPFFRQLELEKHGLHWIHPEIPLAHPLDDRPAALLRRSVFDTAEGLAGDEQAYLRMMSSPVARWQELATEFLQPLLHLPTHPIQLARFGLLALRSAVGLAQARFKNEPARALFAGLAAHSFLPLEQRASAAFGLVLGMAGHAVGWPLPRGGAQQISDALAAHLRSLGGEIK